MTTTKKIYTIRITGAKENIWYASKIGKKYEAEKSGWNIGGFLVNNTFFIHKRDCKIISEKVVNKYYQKQKV